MDTTVGTKDFVHKFFRASGALVADRVEGAARQSQEGACQEGDPSCLICGLVFFLLLLYRDMTALLVFLPMILPALFTNVARFPLFFTVKYPYHSARLYMCHYTLT